MAKDFPASRAAMETVSWYCAVVLVALILMGLFSASDRPRAGPSVAVSRRPCDEIYVVQEGETLHTIGDKCGDPYIVERNPHIHDPDDVFPGLVIRLSPFTDR